MQQHIKNTSINEEKDTFVNSIAGAGQSMPANVQYLFYINNAPSEYITFQEAAVLTGFKFEQIRDLGPKANLTCIGKNAYLKSEFNQYWIYRSQEDRNRRHGEDSKVFLNRVNREWRQAQK